MLHDRQWKNNWLRTAAVIYIALPLFCFIIGFLRWYYSIVCVGVLCWTITRVLSDWSPDETWGQSAGFSRKTVASVFLFTLLWSYLGGMNGYYYQSSDWGCRNAVYFDLIQYDWPVQYDNGSALVYYIGHWLPPASLAKAVKSVMGSMRWGRFAGRMFLWGWSSLGLTLIILMLFRALRAEKARQRVAVVFLFVFFSGMDILGAVIYHTISLLLKWHVLHLEWWIHYQYTSMMACLFWGFNQTIIPWLITLLFLTERDPGNYVFYGTACLLCGPFSLVGLAFLMMIKAVGFCIASFRKGMLKRALQKVFSLQNLTALFFLFPVATIFILSNNSVNSDTAAAVTGGFGFFSREYLNGSLLLFLLMEVGTYMLFIFPNHRKDPLFYAMGISFLVIPFFHIGHSNDFCMRASIPAIFILMIYVNRFLVEHFRLPGKSIGTLAKQELRYRICAWFAAACFFIGMATPLMELYRGAAHVWVERTIFLEDQSVMTFNTDQINYNFTCIKPEEQFFFQHLSG